MRRILVAGAACLILVAAGLWVALPHGARADAQTVPPVQVTLADGKAVTLEPYQVNEQHGLSSGQCGVTLAGSKIETMGSGDTDAYTCKGFVEAGPLPPQGEAQRIGIIYDAGSENADFRTAVILVQTPGGWKVDPDTLGQYDDAPEGKSIAALSKALAK